MSQEESYHEALNNLPGDWSDVSREEKVNTLLTVIHKQVVAVRSGNFDVSLAERVAALVLECQLELTSFFTDAEATAKNGKTIAELVEAEISEKLSAEAAKKPAEAALKRQALLDEKVKEAKGQQVEYEKDFRKWKAVYELLDNHHILFRNISKLS